MVIAALKTLTWGTLAAAVVSAVLMASGGSLPRATATDGARAGQAPASAHPGLAGRRDTAPGDNAAAIGVAVELDRAPH